MITYLQNRVHRVACTLYLHQVSIVILLEYFLVRRWSKITVASVFELYTKSKPPFLYHISEIYTNDDQWQNDKNGPEVQNLQKYITEWLHFTPWFAFGCTLRGPGHWIIRYAEKGYSMYFYTGSTHCAVSVGMLPGTVLRVFTTCRNYYSSWLPCTR